MARRNAKAGLGERITGALVVAPLVGMLALAVSLILVGGALAPLVNNGTMTLQTLGWLIAGAAAAATIPTSWIAGEGF